MVDLSFSLTALITYFHGEFEEKLFKMFEQSKPACTLKPCQKDLQFSLLFRKEATVSTCLCFSPISRVWIGSEHLPQLLI